MSTLFQPLTLGEVTLKNRIVMAPLTRCRAVAGRVPNDLMATYYRQRAQAGMILTEATSVDPMGVGYPDTPGIWSQTQVAGWKKITQAVHAEGGVIFCQLWHVGRVSDPSYLNGRSPLAPSAIAPKGHVSLIRPEKPFVTPKAMDEAEIQAALKAYAAGAQNAEIAGFDGVELHGANGYLVDQFLQSSTNQRTDRWGGSLEYRARFMLEATDALIRVWGPGRVGVHLAPRCDAHDMGDADPSATFSHVAKALGERKIAFLCARESYDGQQLGPRLKTIFGGAYIANQNFTQAQAESVVGEGLADAVAFGKLYIANPDLVERFRRHAALNAPKPESFYGPDAVGYTDYPTLPL